jgi:hypothetical protein
MIVRLVTSTVCWLGVALLLSCAGPTDSRRGEEAGSAARPVASPSGDAGLLKAESAVYRLGRALSVQNLTVWPVDGGASDVGVFLTLADAESRGVAEIREKEGPDSSGAEVNRLVVVKSLFVCRSALRAQGVGAPHDDPQAATTLGCSALSSDMSR